MSTTETGDRSSQLGLEQVDVLGFSLGGYVALELAPILDQYPTPFADHVDAFLNGG